MSPHLTDASTTWSLDNGMTLVTAPDTAATTVAMSITWRAGFVDDPDPLPGLAHLIEHLMFQGTDRHGRQQYYRAYFGSGGCTNAYTRSEHTTYHCEFPTQLLSTAVALEADRFGRFAPTEQAVEQECALISREIAETTAARPLGGFPWEQVQDTLFADTAHAHNGYVPLSGCQRATPARCQEFVASRYRPGDATVALVGRLDPARALDLVADSIGRLPPGEAPPWRRPRPVPKPAARVLVKAPAAARRHASALGWGLPRPWLTPSRRAALVVLADILQGDSRAGLPRRLHEQGIRGVLRADFGMFGDLYELSEAAYLTIQAYHGPTQRGLVCEALAAAVESLAAGPPAEVVRASATGLVRLRRRMLADPLNRARLIAEHRTLWSDAYRPWAVLDELAATDAEAVAEAARWLVEADRAEVSTHILGVDR